ncbi:hypothetical protein FACS1894188_10900 [Clostridia bacterium]|nr:hypothetical protein FACS1894188_10900 [Clostridia bacterium]
MDSVGERTKLLRKLLNLTQKDYSKIIGMSQGGVSDIENNRINIRLRQSNLYLNIWSVINFL